MSYDYVNCHIHQLMTRDYTRITAMSKIHLLLETRGSYIRLQALIAIDKTWQHFNILENNL